MSRDRTGGPRVSIVIPLFDQVACTTACLVALSENTGIEDYEVVLVDNGSTDGTDELLRSLEGDVQVIRNGTNRGFAVASNQGAAAARADVVVFLNNDTEPGPGWLEPLLEVLDLRQEVAAVGSCLVFPDGTVQHAGIQVVEDLVHGVPLIGEHRLLRVSPDDPAVRQAVDLQALTGACLAVRRDVFHRVGGFDERYWNGCEDVDLCFALAAAGHVVAYEPRSVLLHHESASGAERFTRIGHNLMLLRDKWWGAVVPELVRDAHGLRPHPARRSRAARRSWQREVAAARS